MASCQITSFRDRDGDYQEDAAPVREILPPPPPAKPVNTESVQDFPTLEGAAPATVLPITSNGAASGQSNSSIAQRLALKSGLNVSASSSAAPGRPNWNAKVSGASKLDEEFPALGGPVLSSSASAAAAPSYASSSSSRNPNSQSQHHASKSFMNFAGAGQMPSQQHKSSNKSISKSQQNGFVEEEFPSLGHPSMNGGGAWSGSGVKMKPVPRTKKVAPAPNLSGRKVEVDTSDDFHFVPLSVSKARRDSISEKFDVKVEDGPEPFSKDKSKKKKKNREKDDNSNHTQLNAAAIFTGGSLGHVEHTRHTEDDFPSLQAIRSSLPTGPGGRRPQ